MAATSRISHVNNSVCTSRRLLWACGRASAASPRPEPLRPQASIVRAPRDGPTPAGPGALAIVHFLSGLPLFRLPCLEARTRLYVQPMARVEACPTPTPLQAPTLLSPRIRYIYREVPLFPAALSSSKSWPRAVSIISSLIRFISRFFFRSRADRPLSDARGESPPSFGRTCRPQRESGETPRRSYRRSARPRSCQRLSLALRRQGPESDHVSWLWLRASDK